MPSLTPVLLLLLMGIEIQGDLKLPSYRAARLSASQTLGVDAIAIWFINPDDRVDVIEESSSRLVFVAPPGRYSIRLVVKEPGKSQESARAEVVIGDPPGPKPPDPAPPKPEPDSPEALSIAWCVDVKSPNKAAEASSLASSFDSVASRIEVGEWRPDGNFVEQRQAVKSVLRESNRSALTTNRLAWMPWFEKNQVYLDEFDKSASSLMDYAKLWRRQAAGLRRVQ